VLTINPSCCVTAQFVLNYLNICMQTLLSVLKKDGKSEERASAFIALGEISQSVGTNIKPYLDQLIAILKNALNVKNRGYCLQSLTCVSMISSVVGAAMQKDMHEILGTTCILPPLLLFVWNVWNGFLTSPPLSSLCGADLMFSGGLNPTLTEALTELAIHIPSMLPNIQEKLMDHLSMVLAGKPFLHPGNRTTKFRKSVNMTTSPNLMAQPVRITTNSWNSTSRHC
jgi:FKBP12-rapamycin complex-associated protein